MTCFADDCMAVVVLLDRICQSRQKAGRLATPIIITFMMIIINLALPHLIHSHVSRHSCEQEILVNVHETPSFCNLCAAAYPSLDSLGYFKLEMHCTVTVDHLELVISCWVLCDIKTFNPIWSQWHVSYHGQTCGQASMTCLNVK